MAGALKDQGHNILEIWSLHYDNAKTLADKVEATAVLDLEDFDQFADLYIISVSDDSIAEVQHKLHAVSGLVVHTSGATDINILSSIANYGVMYPLQTFSKGKRLDFKNVPVCIEASDPKSLETLKTIANEISNHVYEIDSQKRKTLHLSAVFACNFVNYMYAVSSKLLEKSNIDFDILRPLILETAMKAQIDMPGNIQTGPAVRGDKKTISDHLNLLADNPELSNIYQTLTEGIKKNWQ